MKATFLRLQHFMNDIISTRLKRAAKLFRLKVEFWDDKTLQVHINEEIYKASCELIGLHDKFPILHEISFYPDLKNVLWESSFVESLSPEERKKYRHAKDLSLDLQLLKENPFLYDDRLPYFSGIISTIYLTQFIAYLQSYLFEEKTQNVLINKKSTFEAQFTSSQMEILTSCVNEVKLFTISITVDVFKNILTCNLSEPLKTRNNRLLVYFFSALDDRSLIARNWQSVIDKNRLFLSSGKGKLLKQSDLSTANSEIKITPPIGSETIDKYFKLLKEYQ